MEIYSILQQPSPITEAEFFPEIVDKNLSDSQIRQYTMLIHDLLDEEENHETAKQIVIDFLRVNPLLAVRIMESCLLYRYAPQIIPGLRLLLSAINGSVSAGGQPVILNPSLSDYLVLLVEATFQNSVKRVWDTAGSSLSIAADYSKGKGKEEFLSRENIRHILRHIPQNRQIDLINWLWDQHCYAAKKFGKQETYTSKRVRMIMQELRGSCIWKHLENLNGSQLSQRERLDGEQEAQELAKFIRNVLDEGNHLDFIPVVLGDDNVHQKLQHLLGASAVEAYEAARKRDARQRRDFHYHRLATQVKEKYSRLGSRKGAPLLGHGIEGVEKYQQLSLWNFWQGFKFDDVTLMVIKLDWGSLNQQDDELKECLRKIRSISRGQYNTLYYSCKYASTDHNLQRLFDACFQRTIRKKRYYDLFFTTLCLGYRASKDTVLTDEMVISDIDDFLLPELRVVQPKAVLCLGQTVYDLFMDGMRRKRIEIADNPSAGISLPHGEITVNQQPIRVYGMPFCGGKLSRDAYQEQLAIWNAVRKDLEDHGIRL